MVENIFGARFVGARTPAWHALGTVIPDGQKVSVEEALKIGGIDYRYHMAPIGFELPTGEFIHSGNRQMVLREPTADSPEWEELGIVSDGYQFLQNDELGRGLDLISKKTGWEFETVGAMGNGGIVFMTLKVGARDVRGDKFDTYLIVSDGKASGRALTVAIAPVRVVCANTLAASDSASTVKVKIPHDTNVATDYEFWLDYVEAIVDAQEKTFQALTAMASVQIGPEAATEIFAKTFPLPEKNAKMKQAEAFEAMTGLSDEARERMTEKLADGQIAYEYWTEHAMRRRSAAQELYDRFNAGEEQGARHGQPLPVSVLKNVKNTPYAALQAATELVDWGGRSNAINAARNSIFGDGVKIKQRAWVAASSYI